MFRATCKQNVGSIWCLVNDMAAQNNGRAKWREIRQQLRFRVPFLTQAVSYRRVLYPSSTTTWPKTQCFCYFISPSNAMPTNCLVPFSPLTLSALNYMTFRRANNWHGQREPRRHFLTHYTVFENNHSSLSAVFGSGHSIKGITEGKLKNYLCKRIYSLKTYM